MSHTNSIMLTNNSISTDDAQNGNASSTIRTQRQQKQVPFPPTCTPVSDENGRLPTVATLVLRDGSAYQGISFGAESRSVAGECVFQTGMSLHFDGLGKKG